MGFNFVKWWDRTDAKRKKLFTPVATALVYMPLGWMIGMVHGLGLADAMRKREGGSFAATLVLGVSLLMVLMMGMGLVLMLQNWLAYKRERDSLPSQRNQKADAAEDR